MDTTAQNQTSSGDAQQVVTPPVTQQTQPVAQVQSVQQPTAPVTPGGKETPPMPTVNQEWIQETPAEMVLPKEAKEVGAETVPTEVLHVSPDVSAQGVISTGTATPIPTEPTVKFPMTEEKAEGILKMHKKVKDSIYWLAMLIVRQFKMMKLQKKPVSSGEVIAESAAPVPSETKKEAA